MIVLSIITFLFVISLIGNAGEMSSGENPADVGPLVTMIVLTLGLLFWTVYNIYCIKTDKPLSETSAAKKLIKKAKKATRAKFYYTPAENELTYSEKKIETAYSNQGYSVRENTADNDLSGTDSPAVSGDNIGKKKKGKFLYLILIIAGLAAFAYFNIIFNEANNNSLKIKDTILTFRIDTISVADGNITVPLVADAAIPLELAGGVTNSFGGRLVVRKSAIADLENSGIKVPVKMKIEIDNQLIESSNFVISGMIEEGALHIGILEFTFPTAKTPKKVIVYNNDNKSIKFKGKDITVKQK